MDAGIYREAVIDWQKVVEIDPTTDAAKTRERRDQGAPGHAARHQPGPIISAGGGNG
ncbi:MAG: hypothetical protein U0527_17565 [Candidatus Eisenbacteria bacterium]